jgi:hypothetical protein
LRGSIAALPVAATSIRANLIVPVSADDRFADQICVRRTLSTVIGIRLVSAAAAALFHLLMLQPGAFAGVLGGLVMTDEAPDAGPDQTVVTEKMPADTADCRTFQAARGIGRGSGQAGDKQWYCENHPALH